MANKGDLQGEGKNPGVVQSVSRAISILHCFEKHRDLGVTEISQMLGLHKSTTFGLISTLTQERLLEQNPDNGKYRLGLGLFALGSLVDNDLRKSAEPYLHKLADQYHETVNLVARDGNNVFYIEKIESPYSMRICTQIGKAMPMYCTAVGKAILAYLGEDETLKILLHSNMQKFTNKTIVDYDEIVAELEEIKRLGYALDNEELEIGLRCIGVPIFGSAERPIGGLSISGPLNRMSDEVCSECGEVLRSYALQIQRAMGY